MEMAGLDMLRAGESGTVAEVGGGGKAALRLLELGLVPGTPVTVTGCAPCGDPVAVRLRGYSLTLRRSEAALVTLRRK